MAISSGPNKNALGLVLVIDAANPKSYTGLGTTLSNAAATSVIHKANIKNGPTYIGQWFGSLNFDDNDEDNDISDPSPFLNIVDLIYECNLDLSDNLTPDATSLIGNTSS